MIGLTSCHHQSTLPTPLQRAEQIMDNHPDSASAILLDSENMVSTYSRENQMYYWLLRIQADDKQDIVQPSDSLINEIVSFYQSYGNQEKLMKAYFYQGSVYRDLHDTVKQLHSFLNCIDVGKGTRQVELLGQAYGQLSSLYSFMNLYQESMEASRNALHFYSQVNKPQRIAGSYNQLGRVFYAMHVPDSAEYYFLKAIGLYEEKGFHAIANLSRMELSVLYRDNRQVQEAKKQLQPLLDEGIRQDQLFLNYASITSMEEETDSTRKYLELIDPQKLNAYGKQKLSNLWAIYYQSAGDYQKALEEMKWTKELSDSITKYENTSAIGHLQALYNYDKWQLQIKQAQNQNRINLLIAILVVFCILLVSGVLSWRIYHKNLEYKKQTIRLQAVQAQNMEMVKKQDVSLSIHSLREAAFSKTHKDDWQDWQLEFDRTFPLFTNHLLVLFPNITKKELLVCQLVKLEMANVDLARILCLTPSGSTKFKTRVAVKISKSDTEKAKLENILATL